MGVYIKNMEMPTSCWDCEVGGAKQMDNATCPFYAMEFWEQENYQDKIADGCPLVPVPPHGRLIDADAAIADIRGEILEHQMNRMKGTPFYIEDLRMMWQRLEDEEFIPTVISAEQEEEKRNE